MNVKCLRHLADSLMVLAVPSGVHIILTSPPVHVNEVSRGSGIKFVLFHSGRMVMSKWKKIICERFYF